MAISTATHASHDVRVLGRRLHYLGGGTGSPLLVLHHSTGPLGWLPIHAQLALRFTTFAPDLPGYGQSERPEWASHPRDIAATLLFLLDELEVTSVSMLGLGIGGWIAAEMAVMQHARFRAMVLAGAPGIQPPEGEIMDQMLVDHRDYVRAGFYDDAKYRDEFGEEPSEAIAELWDFSREMTARLTWKPYMYNPALPNLLPGVRTPTLLVWGDVDRIVPRSTGEAYVAALPNASLELVKDCGHFVDLEQPERLADLVTRHVGD